MKIVHEIHGKPQSGGTGQFYRFKVTEPPPKKFTGFQVDILSTCGGDAIYIEGDGKVVKTMLRSLLLTVETIEKSCRESFVKEVKKTKHCKKCNRWWNGEHDCKYWRTKT